MRRRCQNAFVVPILLLAASAHAQIFRVQAGESTLLNTEGGSVEFKAPDYDGSVGLGYYNDRIQFGGQARYKFRGYTLLAGDENIPFTLPTDIFDASHYFSARGAGVTRKFEDSRFYAFAGTTATWMGTGFFNAATSDRPAGVFFYERKLNSDLMFFSREIVSNTQTALQGVEWKPRKWLMTALTGGAGSNQGYFASSLDAETQTLALKASYVLAGDRFERVTVLSPFASEVNKGNVQMLYKPNRYVSITTGHQNILEPLAVGQPMQQASVNQFSTDLHIDKFYFGSGWFSSHAAGRGSSGKNLYIGRRLGQRMDVNVNYFSSKPQGQGTTPAEKTTVLSGTVRENFSSRFSLLQLISRTSGQTTFAFGGDFTSNRFQFRADYQNVYLPFRPERPFQQALALNVMVRVRGPLQVMAVSNIAPDGRMRYSFGASTYLYRLSGMAANALPQQSFSMAKYVVQGIVTDEQGQAVEGAALQIGKETAFSDSSGHFQLRLAKHGPYVLTVVPDEFLTSTTYEVVTAPAQVRAEADDVAQAIEIVVRRKVMIRTRSLLPEVP
ncbi:MAG TPA: carboxypeptidase-like regulatory domain-containing protein [Candidatus Sulfotelmatobacter sp.]|nr:carboxypeptidase-like regulatory domain-containing protein [Candidatus Sulfotelmatobacter sp.]